MSQARARAASRHRGKSIKIGITLPAIAGPSLPLQGGLRRRFARNPLICGTILDQTCSKPWGKLRLLTLGERRKDSTALIIGSSTRGVFRCLIVTEQLQQR